MNKIFYFGAKLLLILLAFTCNVSASTKIIIPPFENFSNYQTRTEYETIIRDNDDITKITRVSFPIDQYSEISRSILENKVQRLGGSVIERTRVDQIINEQKLTQNNKYVNEQTALSMGKLVGASTLLMGSILSFRINEEIITAYGLNQRIKTIVCAIRIRMVDIKSGKLLFSDIVEGENKIFSSGAVRRITNNEMEPALSKALHNFTFPERVKSLILN